MVMLDLRGHGHSGRPHDPGAYGLEIFAEGVRSLVAHLGLGRAALVGYSMGAWICCHLLGDPWVSKAALCGADSFLLEGEWPEFGESMAALSRCFLQGSWDDHPDFAIHRDWASLDSCGPTSPLSAWSPPPPARFPARW